MRKKLLLFLCITLALESFSQNTTDKIFFNGIDTFFLGDKEEKYTKDTLNGKLKLTQTHIYQNQISSNYRFQEDSLFAFKIDTISFKFMNVCFSNSILDNILLIKHYKYSDYINPYKSAKSNLDFLKDYISEKLQIKAVRKILAKSKDSKRYEYQWKNKFYEIILVSSQAYPNAEGAFLYLSFSNLTIYDNN